MKINRQGGGRSGKPGSPGGWYKQKCLWITFTSMFFPLSIYNWACCLVQQGELFQRHSPGCVLKHCDFLAFGQQNHVVHAQHLLFSGHSVQLSSLGEMMTFTTITSTRQLSWLPAMVGPRSKWLPSGRTSAPPLRGLWMQQHARREDIALCP